MVLSFINAAVWLRYGVPWKIQEDTGYGLLVAAHVIGLIVFCICFLNSFKPRCRCAACGGKR
jgi:hypothetical protein